MPATPRPPPITTAPVLVDVDAVVFETVITPDSVGLPENVPDKAPLLIVGDVRVLFVRVCVPVKVVTVESMATVTAEEPL